MLKARLLAITLTVPVWLFGLSRASAETPPLAADHPSGEGSQDAAAGAVPEPAAPPLPAPPLSAEAEARREAGQRFQRGLGFYNDGDYALALIEFDRAYLLVPDYRVLYNIGQVSIQLSRFARARQALEQYLAEGQGALTPVRTAEVERDLKMAADRTAYLEISSSTAGADLLIDERSYGELPLSEPLLLDAGEHQLVLRKSGFQTATRRMVLAGAERLSLSIDLVPIEPEPVALVRAPARVSSPTRAPKVPHPDGPRGPSPALLAWVGTGALATGAAVFGALGLVAKGTLDELKARPNPDQAALDGHASDATLFFASADILAGATVLAAGASIYLSVVSGRSSAEKPAPAANRRGLRALEIGVGATRLSLRGTF